MYAVIFIACFLLLAQNDPNDVLAAAPNDVNKPSTPSRDNNMVDDVYHKYIMQDRDDAFFNEHEYFLKAQADMQRHHHDRVTGVSAHVLLVVYYLSCDRCRRI